MTFYELFEALHEFVLLMKMPHLHDKLSFVSDKEYDSDKDKDSDTDKASDTDKDSDNGSMYNNSDNNFIETGYES